MAKKRRRKKQNQSAAPATPSLPLTAEMAAQIEAWAEESAQSLGLVALDVEVVSRGFWKIMVMAQRPGNPEPGDGITIEECAKVSRTLELLLDTDERVPENYTLEVSSPGIERNLRKPAHYEQVVGQNVRLKMRESIDGEYNFMGHLKSVKGPGPQQLELEVIESQKHNGETLIIEIESIKKAHVAHDFEGTS